VCWLNCSIEEPCMRECLQAVVQTPQLRSIRTARPRLFHLSARLTSPCRTSSGALQKARTSFHTFQIPSDARRVPAVGDLKRRSQMTDKKTSSTKPSCHTMALEIVDMCYITVDLCGAERRRCRGVAQPFSSGCAGRGGGSWRQRGR
jgi:hypothetical protein